METIPFAKKKACLLHLLRTCVTRCEGYELTYSWAELLELGPPLEELTPDEITMLVRFCGSSGLLCRYKEDEHGFSAAGVAQLIAYQIDPKRTNQQHYGSVAIRTFGMTILLFVAHFIVKSFI